MNIDNLNNKQKEAVINTDGPMLILAGAGSGKTKVLTTKIAYLIEEKGIDPYNILAITFTNKAANEMKSRVENLLGISSNVIQISTFHSFGLSIIKRHYEKLGFKSNFTIIDSDDSLATVKRILKDMNLDPKFFNPKTIRNKISSAKNELMSPSDLDKFTNNEIDEVTVKVYIEYQKKLKVNNSLDFDDLLMLPIILFNENKEILKYYQERFKYILIDEYQDTNQVQYILTKMLSAKYKNICVVGDPDQSIYGFRGSNYRNILNFEKDYKDTKTILLEQNYRSTKNILSAANDVIKNNKNRKEKDLWTDNTTGEKIKYKRCDDEKDEANYVVSNIKKLIKENVPLEEICILYRTNAQSRNIEEAFLRENIPYKVVGSFYFYNRKEIKDLISYLKLIYNPSDDISLTRIINVPKRGIGLKTMENLTTKANILNESIFNTIDSGKELEFKKIILELQQMSEQLSLTELVDLVLDKTGIRKELEIEDTIESQSRLENLEEFKSITKSFEEKYGVVSLAEFLDEISLVSDVEEHKNRTDVVTLMTVHYAKGLEFDYIFLVGLEEGVFPHSMCLYSNDEIEEERRLCYVAITRARKDLTLLNTKKRLLYGQDSYNPPSRFIEEISNEYLDKEEIKQNTNSKLNKIFKSSNINQYEEYTPGEKVIHDKYGEGVVISVDKSILTIAFAHPHGIVKIMKGHKSLKKMES
ncbi:MAG: UvrD-helicase domain-containing protein [Bacilli bacterium]|nr:UvrD-helicase domain-containing protein [Bacilli bacterium]